MQKKREDKYCLYGILQVDKKSTSEEIVPYNIKQKKQYRKLVFMYHPDKNKQDPDARDKFQKLQQAYDILMDPQKRLQYDQTGNKVRYVGSLGNLDQSSFQSAYEYFRKLYKKITEEDIMHFQNKYRFSAEQQEDLINYYNRVKGNIVNLLQNIPLSRQQDIARYIQFYQQKINDGLLGKYKVFQSAKNKINKLPNQQEEFKKLQKQQKQGMSSLIMAIQNKKQDKTFLHYLQQKYTQTNKNDKVKTKKNKK